MLKELRIFSRTPVAKVLLIVLGLSFLGFGVSGALSTLGSQTVAHVGSEEISVKQFQRAYSAQLDSIFRQYGVQLTAEQAVTEGIPGQVLAGLQAEAAINGFGEGLGLGVSDARLRKMANENPNFAGTLGGYDPDVARQALQQMGYTEAEFKAEQTDVARKQQFELALFADAAVPEAAKTLINRYQTDTRTVDYFVLSPTSVPMTAEATDADLAAYLAAHQDKFRTVETRSIDLIDLTPQALVADNQPTDEEIAAEYEKSKDSLTKVEKRHILQVVLPSDEVAKAFADGKTAGKTFDQLVTEAGLKATDLGTVGQTELADSALATAAFGLAQGDFVVIPGVAGQRAVSVSEIQAGGLPPLAEVKDDIAKRLALTAAKNQYSDILDQIEELRASFQPMQTIADRYKLPLHTVAVSASGAELQTIPELSGIDTSKIVATIQKAEVGKLAPTVSLGANHNVWIDLKSIEPARDQTLAEVRDAVLQAWTDEKTEEALQAASTDAQKQLTEGKSLIDVAAAFNQIPDLSPAIHRDGSFTAAGAEGESARLPATNVLDARVASAIFDGGEDHFGTARNADGDIVVFKVTAVTAADGEIAPQLVQAVDSSSRNSLYEEFVRGILAQTPISQNEAVLSQLLSLSPSGQ